MLITGKVYLVGAGPGDVGLLTLRGADLLKQADVVVYDALVNRAMLKWVQPSAKIIFAGKRSRDHAIPQDELNQLLVTEARKGLCVVRLKGGDPYTFGRGGEEIQELVEHGIDFEVVPGISSISAVPNYAGIPITHRDYCSSFTVITGHEDPQKPESRVYWENIAREPGTKIVLMGVERIGAIAAALMAHGMLKDTPVAMIRWGSTSRQESLVATLETIAHEVQIRGFKAPAVTVIGNVVKLRDSLNWFERRPLLGRRIVVTRTRKQASELSRELTGLGAEILEIPTIKIGQPDDTKSLVEAMAGLNGYDWIVFTSPNGVESFFQYFFKAFDDLRDLGGVRIAAVGPATATKLKELHLRVDVMPEKYLAGEIAQAMKAFASLENERVLLMRAQVANRELMVELELEGAIVDDVSCYKTVPETIEAGAEADLLREEGADWITFTSSSTVEHFHTRFDLPYLKSRHPGIKLLSIGPETSTAIKALALSPDVEADEHHIQGMIKALIEHSVKDCQGQ